LAKSLCTRNSFVDRFAGVTAQGVPTRLNDIYALATRRLRHGDCCGLTSSERGDDMQTITPVPAFQQSDPQVVKQWAAEDFAIAIGLLRECPYHGQPFKAHKNGLTRKALAAGLVDPNDPIIQAFNGNTRELLAAVERVTGDYGEHCALCTATDQEEFD
jgi:hypothetical protein